MRSFSVSVRFLLLTLCEFSYAGSGAVSLAQGQACAGEAAQIRDIDMNSVRIGRKVRWADGSAAIRLGLDGTHGVCWVSAKGDVEQITFREGAAPGQEQACAGEASQIKGVPMSALRSQWAAEGPNGAAWVSLKINGKNADCHISGSGDVLEIAF